MIADRIRESDQLWFWATDAGHVIGHQHVWVANFLVDLESLQHIDMTFVWKGLDKVAESTADVSEVDVEDFVAFAEVADDAVNLLAWFLKHFTYGSLAEV